MNFELASKSRIEIGPLLGMTISEIHHEEGLVGLLALVNFYHVLANLHDQGLEIGPRGRRTLQALRVYLTHESVNREIIEASRAQNPVETVDWKKVKASIPNGI